LSVAPEKTPAPVNLTTQVSSRRPGRSPAGRNDLPGPGATLAGKYELVRVLGQGGMGMVMEALDLRLGRRVAIKMMLSEAWQAPDLVARFEREARAAARLQSPYTIRLLDVDVAKPALPFMVMEFLEGRSLDAELTERGQLPVAEAVSYVLQACEAMAEAHDAGIIHRDIKPANLFVSSNGGRRAIKVLDFGISKLTGEEERALTMTRSTFGTPEYMSPEQVRAEGPLDGRSDVWALGVVLYQLLAGSTPFGGNTAPAVFASIITHTPAPLRPMRPDVPVELEFILARALCKNPNERYPSALDFARALSPFAEPAPRMAFESGVGNMLTSDPPRPLVTETGPSPVVTRRTRRRPAILSALGVASAVVGVVAVWLGWGAEQMRPNGAALRSASSGPAGASVDAARGGPGQAGPAVDPRPADPAADARPAELSPSGNPASAAPPADDSAGAKRPPGKRGATPGRRPPAASEGDSSLPIAPDGHPVRF
jgi:eukaryotic-like serine/threonine-protein kinase